MSFFIALSPVLLILVMVVVFQIDLLPLSLLSFAYTAAVAALFFSTTPKVLALASLDGVLTTLPLLLVVYAGILISQFLLEKGSLQRLTLAFSRGVEGKFRKAMLIAAGFGNFFEGAGVIAEPVVAPMLYSVGISPTGSAVLSILGYAGLMHLALAGVIVTVLANVTSLPLQELAITLALLSFPATLFLYTTIPIFMGEPKAMLRHLPMALAVSTVITLSAYLSVQLVGFSISAMVGGLSGIVAIFALHKTKPTMSKEKLKDTAPFLFLLLCLGTLNTVPALRELVNHRLSFGIRLIGAHTITFRPLGNAYLYLFGAFLLSYRIFSKEGESMVRHLRLSLEKAIRPLISMAVFGAMGSVIAFSGFSTETHSVIAIHNMAHCLAQGIITYTGGHYPIFAPLLGWMGTFLTGYGVASIMLFGKLQIATASMLGVSKTLLASSLTVGASIGSISSPFKIAIAAPLCDAVGRESEILRWSIPIGMGISLMVGLCTTLIF